jgi:hypothetical protein
LQKCEDWPCSLSAFDYDEVRAPQAGQIARS